MIPDSIPFAGFLDDAIVAAVVVAWCEDSINNFMKWFEAHKK
ncbi:MAG: DUF1232 domain-containing protein [Clostridiales bacterium]|nr:DUF1232 domain-containing protein [Clostridiales bacterium]